MDTDLATLAEAYLRERETRNNEDFWAWEEVHRRIRVDLAEAWEVTLSLVEKSGSDSALAYVAAGPLEDLVDGYGDSALDVIEAECETNQKLQRALSGIWLERESPVLMRWRSLMDRYGFMDGGRQPLSTHPDCWF
jgi:hypothetical protein